MNKEIKNYIEAEKNAADRVVIWFSCGVTSAVAAQIAIKYVLELYPDMEIVIAYCDPGAEHKDNYRFLEQVETWLGYPITILKSPDYKDIYDVFKQTKWLVGVQGARCTTEMKKRVRQNFERLTDIQVFGFDSSEYRRVEKFRANNPEVRLWTPLLDDEISKEDCKKIIEKAKIELPLMYKLGFKHNNCVGCVKGGKGYWNKIREHFPDEFERMAKIERELDVSILREQKNYKRTRVFLDELKPNEGDINTEPAIQCGLDCNQAYDSKNQ